MIYSILAKFSKINNLFLKSNLLNYTAYLIFIIFVVISTLISVTYAQGGYTVSPNSLTYVVDEDNFNGRIALPPLFLSCPDNGGVIITFKVKVSKFKTNNLIEVSTLDKNNNESKHQLKRMFGTEPIVISYTQSLGDLDLNSLVSFFVADYPFSTIRIISLQGEFNKGMQFYLYDLKAYSDLHNQCLLKWAISVEN